MISLEGTSTLRRQNQMVKASSLTSANRGIVVVLAVLVLVDTVVLWS